VELAEKHVEGVADLESLASRAEPGSYARGTETGRNAFRYAITAAISNHRLHAAVKRQAAVLLRDVIGKPFRPVVVDPSWLTPTVTALAATIYEDRAFDRMPILADALEEAGCDNEEVVTHCRGPGPHVRGCWVLDLLTGRE
jgi:hypothetical protein